jgi:hypothetical protein
MTTAREKLAVLVKALQIPDWQCRSDGDGIAQIAGSRGRIVLSPQGLALVLGRSASPLLVLQLKQAGLLAVAGRDATLRLARMPEPTEVSSLRELLGLFRDGGVYREGNR